MDETKLERHGRGRNAPGPTLDGGIVRLRVEAAQRRRVAVYMAQVNTLNVKMGLPLVTESDIWRWFADEMLDRLGVDDPGEMHEDYEARPHRA